MKELNKNNIGLSLGIIFVAIHVLWFIILVAGFGQHFLSWIIETHFIKINIEIIEFNLFLGIMTLIRAFVVGYITGWLFAFIYNKLQGVKK